VNLILVAFIAVSVCLVVFGLSLVFNDTDPGEVDHALIDKGGIPMVFVPAGEFVMGCEKSEKYGCPESEKKIVHLEAFYIDVYETRATEYRECVEAGSCGTKGLVNTVYGSMPAQYASHYQANRYCEFRGKRLPTSQEWEKAARGPDGGHRYPWGDQWIATRANWCDGDGCDGSSDGYAGPAPVDAFPENVSPYGVRNMVGNMMEWVADMVRLDPPADNSLMAVWRGGAFAPDNSNGNPEKGLVTWNWWVDPPESHAPHIGFRCASSENGTVSR
jgi:formylglycine-generating enzyme required for sulfatase activity